ncbi:MAG: hypothetical protein R2685_10475 [Candidatus Nitrosocosmicus sp.]|nr:hypothetical protein [Candidatus Nitrosocosmicus sp.]
MSIKKKLEIEIEVEAKRNIIDMEVYDKSEGEVTEELTSKERVGEAILDCLVRHITDHIEEMYDDEDYAIRNLVEDEIDCDFEDYELGDIADISINCEEVE